MATKAEWSKCHLLASAESLDAQLVFTARAIVAVPSLAYTETMGAHESTVDFEPVIWARLIQAPKAPISPDAARYLLSINFNEADSGRMQQLMDKSNEGAMTPDEAAELDGYVNIANLLSVMHSQARIVLKIRSSEPQEDHNNS